MDAEKLLKHMAWANQEIFAKVAELPDEALDAYAVNPEWTAREIIRHIASSASWYGYRLEDHSQLTEQAKEDWHAKLDATQIPPATMKDMGIVLDRIAAADAVLLAASHLPDAITVLENENGRIERTRSTIISQSVHHATEHRAQLISALEAKGFTAVNLDDYDLWAFSGTVGY